jgi:hypothetical protein
MLQVCHAIRYFDSRRYGDIGMSANAIMTSLHFASLAAFKTIGKWFIP